jgi:hypothetical protein
MKYWIKLYIEILDDPKMARLPNHLWRRLVELFLLAGRQGDDGALPPVEETAWSLRLSEDKLLEDLQRLAEVGVVQKSTSGIWSVTHFKERQGSESLERVRRYRQRYRNTQDNGEGNQVGAADASTSPSPSSSLSDSDSSEAEKGQAPRSHVTPAAVSQEPPTLPASPAEALLHRDVRVYSEVTGGRLPGMAQYRTVIEAVRFLRAREKLDNPGLQAWLKPYWLAWSGRKRLDGRPYDPGNLTWLVEWALNASIPSKTPATGHSRVPSPEETRRMLAEREEKVRNAVPPPEHIQARMRSLQEGLVHKAPS